MSNIGLYFGYSVNYQLSPVNFPSESSPLPSPGIKLTLFGYVAESNQRLYLLSRLSIEINTIWEPVIRSAREKQ